MTSATRRPAGERTHAAILREAVSLATVHGLDGLSIGDLAAALDMSKSGLYAHFGSKQDLQLATVEEAGRIFQEEVIEPGLAAAPAGVPQLLALCEAFFAHLERRTFPGGCFFDAAAGDLALERGIVRDKVASFQEEWVARLRRNLEAAVAKGELPPDADLVQILYDITSYLVLAHSRLVFDGNDSGLPLAARAVRIRLGRA